jgi:Carboxypeptidase regulatory-like domain
MVVGSRMLRERMTFSPRKSDRQPLGHALKPGLVVFCLMAVTLVSAQNETTGGVFQGLITDSTGAVIANAHVTLRMMDSPSGASATTDRSGRFKLEALRPGRYQVRVEAMGFQGAESAVTVGTGDSDPASIVLRVKRAQESVTVEGSQVDIETSARAHTEIGTSLTSALPDTAVNGGFSTVLTLGSPGVAADSNGSFHPLGEHAEVSPRGSASPGDSIAGWWRSAFLTMPRH